MTPSLSRRARAALAVLHAHHQWELTTPQAEGTLDGLGASILVAGMGFRWSGDTRGQDILDDLVEGGMIEELPAVRSRIDHSLLVEQRYAITVAGLETHRALNAPRRSRFGWWRSRVVELPAEPTPPSARRSQGVPVEPEENTTVPSVDQAGPARRASAEAPQRRIEAVDAEVVENDAAAPPDSRTLPPDFTALLWADDSPAATPAARDFSSIEGVGATTIDEKSKGGTDPAPNDVRRPKGVRTLLHEFLDAG